MLSLNKQHYIDPRYIVDIRVSGREDHCWIEIHMFYGDIFIYKHYSNFYDAERELTNLIEYLNVSPA